MKKLIGYILVTILSLSVLFWILEPAKADSGWDTSYDSGGSWDSGGSLDYGSSHSSSGSSYSLIEIFTPPILYVNLGMVVFGYICISLAKRYSDNKFAKERSKNYQEINKDEYYKLIKDFSIEDLRQKAFEIYEQIQYAWSNFDYETLKNFTTDELYNMYVSQLKPLKVKKQQNIMKKIEKEEVKIISVDIINNITTVKAFLRVKCYDYIINTKTNKVVRGSSRRKLRLEYIITLVKDNNSKSKVNCPNCGKEVDIISSKKCEYCDSTLVQNASDFVMSDKEMKHQEKI